MIPPMIELPNLYNASQTFVDENVARNPHKVAIRCDGQSYTYQQVADMVGRMANALRGLDVRMEDRVLLLMHDTPEFVAGFLGAIRLGAVPVPVNTNMKPQDYEYFLNDSRAVAAIVSEPLLGQLEEVRSNLRFVRHVVSAGRQLAELLAQAKPDCEVAPTSKDDACFWLYSSGTTGFPKGTVHLQHDAIYTTDTYAKQVLGVGPEDRILSVAKLFFAYGLGNGLTFPFRFGATSILHSGRPDPASMFEVIERERPTVFCGVPTSFAAMLAADDEHHHDLSSIRVATSAGEALPASIYERWKERFGHDILDGIGSTEILHIFISNQPEAIRPGSSGRPVAGYQTRIVGDDDQPLPPGEVGNLLVRGDSTCTAYWNKHSKTRSTIEGYWIRTGDKYSEDSDGFLWYAGRGDDMLKVGGIWVSPVEVENALVAHPAVLEAGVVGKEDHDRLIKPLAYVVLTPGQTSSAELGKELQEFVRHNLAEYKRPRWVEFVAELPKTGTGKTQRFKLRQQA
jgi:benzoate-CoA ligase family protein